MYKDSIMRNWDQLSIGGEFQSKLSFIVKKKKNRPRL